MLRRVDASCGFYRHNDDLGLTEQGIPLFSGQELRRIVSGERTDIAAKLLRPLLAFAAWQHGLIIKSIHRRFETGKLESHRVDVPIVCVGNITAGGTGKTPMVAFLCQWFRERGLRVAIVSRGYRAQEGKPNDEARELSERLPDVPHIQNPDRVAAATVAAEELEMQVVVLDDGFQHRRLERDLDLVLIDALEPFGFDWLLPRGFLREPVEGLKRAGVVALSRADLVSDVRREELRRRVAELAPDAAWIELAHTPTQLIAGEISESLESLHGKRVLAFCGLGNPTGFRRTLEQCGAEIVDFIEFPDHHEYSRDDIEKLREALRSHGPAQVVCTHKDMVKVELDQLDGVPIRALLVEQRILQGEGLLDAKLTEIADRAVQATVWQNDFLADQSE